MRTTNEKVYDEATEVTADEGNLRLDGPDAVDVRGTPVAADQTIDNLIKGVAKARGQERLSRLPHQPDRAE